MGRPDHLTCLLGNLYVGQEATVRIRHEQQTGSKLEKEYKAIYSHPAYLTYMKGTSCKMLGWESHAGIKIAGRNINNLRYTDETTLMGESEEELKTFLMGMNEESEKTGLKFSIKKTKTIASNPITSWQIEGNKVETMTDCIFLGSKITTNGDCSHESRKHAPWKKSYDKPRQCIKKLRHHFANKHPYIQSYDFSSSHYGCKSWTIKKR